MEYAKYVPPEDRKTYMKRIYTVVRCKNPLKYAQQTACEAAINPYGWGLTEDRLYSCLSMDLYPSRFGSAYGRLLRSETLGEFQEIKEEFQDMKEQIIKEDLDEIMKVHTLYRNAKAKEKEERYS